MYKVYILHGWSYSTKKWEPFLKLLRNTGIEYKVLKIPGLTAPLRHVWTLDNYASWLYHQTSKIGHPISILGHSNGGRIAAAFAAKYPERVSHLILIDSAGIIDKRLKNVIKKNVFKIITRVGKKITTQTSLKTLIYKLTGEQDYNKADPILKETMLNLISQDLEPIFSKIKVPTLIIWGRDDKATPLSDGKRIYNLISDSKFEVIENAKHSPQFTRPKDVAKIILNFLNHVTI